MKVILRILFLLFLLLFQSTGSCYAETKIFTVQHRLASEILPVVQASLSANGKAIADNIGNTIIVNDSPEIIAEINNILLSSDQRVPQVRVQLSFDSVGARPGRVLSTRRDRGTAFVTVSSGSSGYIRMAREVPITDQWLILCRRYGVPILLKETKTLETGMEVTAVAVEDQVILTITPRISWVENGRVDSFHFVDATTKVTIPRSQWVNIAGITSSMSDSSNLVGKVLSTTDLDKEDKFLIRIKADVN